MRILEELSRLAETVRAMDRAELADELGSIVERLRRMDREEIVDEMFDILEKVRELLLENDDLRRRLKARLQGSGGSDDLSYPYEGIYWFDSRTSG